MKKLLESVNACKEARIWASDKTWEEIYNSCERGDWLLWLFKKTNPGDLKLITIAKAHCANTVRHLMKDKRSTDALDAAILFAEGKITIEELHSYASSAASAAYAASSAAAAAAAAASDAAAYASSAASDAAAAAAYDSYDAASDAAAAAAYSSASYATSDAAAAAYAAAAANLKETADICRKYLPIEIWNIPKNL